MGIDSIDGLLADQPDLMTPAEVAELLRVTQQTIARWRREGDLPAFTMGRTIRIRKEDLRLFLRRAYEQPSHEDPDSPLEP